LANSTFDINGNPLEKHRQFPLIMSKAVAVHVMDQVRVGTVVRCVHPALNLVYWHSINVQYDSVLYSLSSCCHSQFEGARYGLPDPVVIGTIWPRRRFDFSRLGVHILDRRSA
jgi:hypothetical protein